MVELRQISSTLREIAATLSRTFSEITRQLSLFSKRFIELGRNTVVGLWGGKTVQVEFLDLVSGKIVTFTKKELDKIYNQMSTPSTPTPIQDILGKYISQIPKYNTKIGAFFGGLKFRINEITNNMVQQAPRFSKFASSLNTLIGPKMLGNVMGEIRSLAPQMMAFSLVTAPAQAALSGFLDVFSPITDIFEGFGAQLSQAFIPIVQIVADMLLQFMPTLGLIAKLLAPIITLVASVLLEPLRLLADLLKFLNPYIEIAVNAVSQFLQPIIDWIRQSSFLKNIIMAVVDAIKTLVGWFSDLKNGMEEAGENIKGFFGNIGNEIKGWFD